MFIKIMHLFYSIPNGVFVDGSMSVSQCLKQTAICHVPGTSRRSAVVHGVTAFTHWNSCVLVYAGSRKDNLIIETNRARYLE